MHLFDRHLCDACHELFDLDPGAGRHVSSIAASQASKLSQLLMGLGIERLTFCSPQCRTNALSRVPWDELHDTFLAEIATPPEAAGSRQKENATEAAPSGLEPSTRDGSGVLAEVWQSAEQPVVSFPEGRHAAEVIRTRAEHLNPPDNDSLGREQE